VYLLKPRVSFSVTWADALHEYTEDFALPNNCHNETFISGSITCKMPIRILVVDDFEPLRRLVCSVLKERAEFEIVGQAADGLDAIRKAGELQPDLILLDIGLPKMNGIAAAPEIHKVAQKAKILFWTQETDPEIVKAAVDAGASGYIVKSGNDLFEAMEAVIQGRQFVSGRLQPPPALPRKRDLTHQIFFYSEESEFLDSFSDSIASALEAGNVVILVATEPHRNGVSSKLQARGLDISSAMEKGDYIALDVAETLSTFMVDGLPDPVQFSKAARDLMGRAKAGKGEHLRVSACGECAGVLWAQGKAEATFRLEQLWDEMAETYNVDVLCGYPLTGFQDEQGRSMFQRLCTQHTAVKKGAPV
jgi:DNA-binding NarL/FixJ family response regulator